MPFHGNPFTPRSSIRFEGRAGASEGTGGNQPPTASSPRKFDLAGSGSPKSEDLKGRPCLSGPKVLVIDDDQIMVRLLATLLTDAGFDTVAAYDAMQGLIVAQREDPSVILLDMQMPAGGGLQVLQRLRTNPKTEANTDFDHHHH